METQPALTLVKVSLSKLELWLWGSENYKAHVRSVFTSAQIPPPSLLK